MKIKCVCIYISISVCVYISGREAAEHLSLVYSNLLDNRGKARGESSRNGKKRGEREATVNYEVTHSRALVVRE